MAKIICDRCCQAKDEVESTVTTELLILCKDCRKKPLDPKQEAEGICPTCSNKTAICRACGASRCLQPLCPYETKHILPEMMLQ